MMADISKAPQQDAWSRDMASAPTDRRLMVWLPQQGYDPARPDFACWNPDRYSAKPRPFWEMEGCLRISMSRARQPIAWRLPPSGPEVGTGLIFPRELTSDLSDVLSMPNFECAHIARAFRGAGRAEIKCRSEDEQAFVLHWLTTLVLEHGAAWRKHAGETLTAVIAEAQAAHEAREAAAAEQGATRG